MSTRMCSCLREVERWADVTPRGNCVSFLGMVGLRPSNVRQKKNEVLCEALILLVQAEVSLEPPQRSTSKHEPKK